MSTINNQNTVAAILTSPTSSQESAVASGSGIESSFHQLLTGQIKNQVTGNSTAAATDSVASNSMGKTSLKKTAANLPEVTDLNLAGANPTLTPLIDPKSNSASALQATTPDASANNPEQTLSSITANRNTSLNLTLSFKPQTQATTLQEHGKIKKSSANQHEQTDPNINIVTADPTLTTIVDPKSSGALTPQASQPEANRTNPEQTLSPITANRSAAVNLTLVNTQSVTTPAMTDTNLATGAANPEIKATELSGLTAKIDMPHATMQNQTSALPVTQSAISAQLPVNSESAVNVNTIKSNELAAIESKSLTTPSADLSITKQSTDTPTSDSFASLMANTNSAVIAANNPQAAAQITPGNTYLNTANWQQEINQKVIWMNHGGQQSATLMLNSPELGPLQVVINVNQAHAQAHFVTDNPQLRQALEDGMAHLRNMMKQSGVELGQTNVQSGNQNQQSFSPPPQYQTGYASSKANVSIERMMQPSLATTIQRSGKGMINTFA